MATDTTVTWLTEEAYNRLEAELETLSTSGREDITKKIESAREEGDLKENSGYHAAKEEQGKIEARIRTLTLLLRNAEVGSAPESHGVVQPGTVITATIAGCQTAPQPLYQWESYQPQVYEYFKGEPKDLIA